MTVRMTWDCGKGQIIQGWVGLEAVRRELRDMRGLSHRRSTTRVPAPIEHDWITPIGMVLAFAIGIAAALLVRT